MQQCNNAPAQEQICIVTSLPESGTRSRLAGLSAEQQQAFDELEAVGAFGPDNSARGCWFGFVRDRLPVVQELLGELRYARASRTINRPGAWMMDKWKRWGRP